MLASPRSAPPARLNSLHDLLKGPTRTGGFAFGSLRLIKAAKREEEKEKEEKKKGQKREAQFASSVL
jgi:hypothetical protein